MHITSYSRPRHKKRRARSWLYLVFVVGILTVYCTAVLLLPLQPVQATAIPLQPHQTTSAHISWPAYGSSAVGTLEHGVLASNGPATPIPTASMTKIVTALVVLEAKPISATEVSPVITFTANDTALYADYLARGGSVAPVSAGLQLNEYQALQAMLLASANNYADSLAIWAYGSLDAYVAAANAYLKKHAINNTTIADATGFSPNTTSTSADLVALGQLAMKQTIVADIASQKTATIPGIGTLSNTNILLGNEGIIGLKTGTTDEAGSCLLFASEYTINGNKLTIIGVVTGAPDHTTLFRDVAALVKDTYASFQSVQVAAKGQAFAHYTTPWGDKVSAVASKDIHAISWNGNPITQHVATRAADFDQSNTAGKVTFNSNVASAELDLVLDKPLTKPSIWWRLTHPSEIM